MTMSPARRRRGSALRGVVAALLLLCLVLPLGALLLAIETAPRVAPAAPPGAADSLRLREMAERMQAFLDAGSGEVASFHASEAEINAALAAVTRLHPGLAGQVAVGEGWVEATLAVGLHPIPPGYWLNLRARLEPDAGGTAITALHVGRLPLPPALAVPAASRLADRMLGPGSGAALERMVAGLRIDPPELSLTAGLAGPGDGQRLERLKARLQAIATGTTPPARIKARLGRLHGTTPGRDRSLLPFLAAAMDGAQSESETRAAVFALALYCGDPRFGLAIGVPLPEAMQGRANRCGGATLGGRRDLARHFVLSAGLHAATTDRTVRGLGEFKELLDSNPAGTGFSFDDIAANLAGARFAATLLAAPGLAPPGAEAEVMPRIDDLPSGLDAESFETLYGDIESPAYAARLAGITARVEALPFHRDASAP